MSQSLNALHDAQINNRTANNNYDHLDMLIFKNASYYSCLRKLQTIILNYLEILRIRLSIDNMKSYRSLI